MRKRGLWSVLAWILLLAGLRQTSGAEFHAALNSITGSEIGAYIDVLADDSFEGREAGSRGGQAAAAYLANQLRRLGVEPAGDRGRYYQRFGVNYRNVLGILRGSDPRLADQWVLVGAHFDHVGYGTRRNSLGPIGYIHNGADDNASGVAAVLEVVEALAMLDRSPKRSVLFAFWDGEEKGMLGSTHWAVHPTVPNGSVVLTIHADMVGRLGRHGVQVFGSRSGTGLRRLVCDENRMTDLPLDFRWQMKANSDHYVFFVRHIPSLLFHTGLHADFHRPTDDPEKINRQGAERVTRLLFTLVSDVANRPKLASFRRQARDEGTTEKAALERVLPTRPSRLGISWERTEDQTPGFRITKVTADSPADRAGLKKGDRLLRFEGRSMDTDQDLCMAILSAEAPATALIQRGEQPVREVALALEGSPLRLGISWREDRCEPGSLIVCQVVPGSAAHWAGVRNGDRIYQIDGRAFSGESEFRQILAEAPNPVELEVERRGRIYNLTVRLPTLDPGE